MSEHVLKIHEQPFNDLLSGEKTAEIRNNDRGFQVGDTVQLHEIADSYTGRVMHRQVTHVQTGYGLPDGLCVLSYAPLISAPGVVLPEVSGLGRDAEHPRALILYLRKEPSDDDIRAIQEALRADR